MENKDLVIIGGGPAGLAAAYSAYQNGIKDITIIERDTQLGGILNQCIHTGFGLATFKEELSGPEYVARFIDLVKKTKIKVLIDTMVIDVTEDKQISYVNSKDGFKTIQARSIILCMGCRERTRGAISIPGDRCSGVFTAGAAQKYINIDGLLVGKRVVILGSGDIGLIMARRMTLEGAKVLACVELMPYSNGLNRNIVQCLNDFNIPLYLAHTITKIEGKKRLEKVTVSKVDEHNQPIPGTEIEFKCDTLLLSVGLIPENELSKKANVLIDRRTSGAIVYENCETSIPGIFACGNVLHVHDLVDFVSEEAGRAGLNAAKYLKGQSKKVNKNFVVELINGDNVGYTVPQKIRTNCLEEKTNIFFRVRKVMKNMRIVATLNGKEIFSQRKLNFAPGEMESIKLGKDLLVKQKGTLEISIKEVK